VIEEDDNDFIDGGTGDDDLFGDDAQGKTGDRDTGIAVRSVVWLDLNGNHIRDEGEPGAAGVTVEIYSPSDPTFHDNHGHQGRRRVQVHRPRPGQVLPGLHLAVQHRDRQGSEAGHPATRAKTSRPTATPRSTSRNSRLVGKPVGQANIGASDVFTLHVNETLTTVNAGVIGDAVLSVEQCLGSTRGRPGSPFMNFNGEPVPGSLNVPVTVRVRTVECHGGVDRHVEGLTSEWTRPSGSSRARRPSRSPSRWLGTSPTRGWYEQFQLVFGIPVSSAPADPVFLQRWRPGLLPPSPARSSGTTVLRSLPWGTTFPSEVRREPDGGERARSSSWSGSRTRAPTSMTVSWKTVDAAAFEAVDQEHYASTGSDYQAGGGALVFLPGEDGEVASRSICLQDTIDEYEERFLRPAVQCPEGPAGRSARGGHHRRRRRPGPGFGLFARP
jgi:hypothetical protein